METVFAALAAVSVTLLTFGLFLRNRRPAVRKRVERLSDTALADPYEASFVERVIRPMLRRATRASASLLPGHLDSAVQARLVRAGRTMSSQSFTTLWLSSGVVLPIFATLLIIARGGELDGRAIGGVGVVAMLGLLLPYMWLRRVGKRRMREIERTLPDAMDLIVTNVEAGLGLQAAMLSVADRFEGPISVEFSRVVRDISIGRSREEALFDLASRTGVADMRLFAHAIAQAERTGISVGRVLRTHARENRERRQQRARELAGKIPVKMTIPTAIFIFPTLLMIVLGPVALKAFEQFRGM